MESQRSSPRLGRLSTRRAALCPEYGVRVARVSAHVKSIPYLPAVSIAKGWHDSENTAPVAVRGV
jgi:hypothetical protein